MSASRPRCYAFSDIWPAQSNHADIDLQIAAGNLRLDLGQPQEAVGITTLDEKVPYGAISNWQGRDIAGQIRVSVESNGSCSWHATSAISSTEG